MKYFGESTGNIRKESWVYCEQIQYYKNSLGIIAVKGSSRSRLIDHQSHFKRGSYSYVMIPYNRFKLHLEFLLIENVF